MSALVVVESCAEYDLFRRAICERDEAAWTAVVCRYSDLVTAWARQHSSGLDHSVVDVIVNQAFERMWQAVGVDRFASFPDVAALLAYLRMCVSTSVLDEARAARRRRFLSLDQLATEAGFLEPAAKDDPAHEVASAQSARQLWSTIERVLPDRVDRLVVYLSFAVGMSPRAICRQYPHVFESVNALYDRKARVLARLRRVMVAS